MATATSVNIGTLISKSPQMHEGRPVIAGTGLLVRSIAWDYKNNMPADVIARERYLTLAQVHAALAYYFANQKEIEDDIAEYNIEYERLEKEWKQARAEGGV